MTKEHLDRQALPGPASGVWKWLSAGMSAFYNQSIRRKLILLLTGIASATVLVACTVLLVYQVAHDRASLRMEALSTAQLISESSAAPLLFHDERAATETLAGLHVDSRVELACLYGGSGELMTRYARSFRIGQCPATVGSFGVRFTRRHLVISRQITFHSEQAGSLYMELSLADLYASLFHLAGVALAAALFATTLAFILASLLQRLISGPILHLTTVASSVSDGGNYLLRAQEGANDETGVLIRQFNMMMDRIQERETELRRAHSGLEATVSLRTRDLRNEIAERKVIEHDLRAARLAAEDANRAKSVFLANMSHELRTPLNAIIGYSEMLHEDAQAAGDAVQQKDLEKVLLSARHLLRLISDILDLSKIEAGQMTINQEPTRAISILKEVMPTAEVLAKRNNNQLRLGKQLWEGTLLLDPLRFRQCLLNLISNACKFTENGTITIDVQPGSVDEQGSVLWSIADNGIGISPEAQGRLFKTFSQVDDSNTRRFGGSGLGLAISQQLCKAMGACITLQSTPGAGSTFIIHIPMYTPPADEVGVWPEERSQVSSISPALHALRHSGGASIGAPR